MGNGGEGAVPTRYLRPGEVELLKLLVDGDAYLRTNDSRWLANLRRNPELGLRIEGREYEAAAHEIPGDEILASVDTASADKYGWQETLIHPFRIRKPQILKLTPR